MSTVDTATTLQHVRVAGADLEGEGGMDGPALALGLGANTAIFSLLDQL